MTTIPVRNPRTGETDAWITPPTLSELDEIAARLRAAQSAWAAESIEARMERLKRWADAIEADQYAIAKALEADTGRRRVAMLEVQGAIASIRGWAVSAPSSRRRPTGRRAAPTLS